MPAKKVVLKTIKDVFFYYTQFKDPVITKKAKDKGIKIDPEKPNVNCEYTIKVVMPYDRYRTLSKQSWAKGASNFPKLKEFTLADFEAAFHKDGGMPDFGDDVEDVVMIKFSQKAWNQNTGGDMNAPKIWGIKGKVQDNNGLTITQETAIGNGSKGHLQVRPAQFADYDPYLYPHVIAITELVEYESSEVGVDEDGLGIEELDEEQLDDKSNPIESDEFDDDIPF